VHLGTRAAQPGHGENAIVGGGAATTVVGCVLMFGKEKFNAVEITFASVY
jgi:hypothetical protein